MSKLGGEKASVQSQLIAYAVAAGWEYVGPDTANTLRGGEAGLVFTETFTERICALNDFMTPELAGELIKRLERLAPNIEGNLAAWEYLKGVRQVFVPAEKRERDVKFIDTDDHSANTFQVTDEFTYTSGTKTIRADSVFLVNGVPVIIGETKSAHKVDGIAEALDQIRRYHVEGPELMALLQVFAMTHIIRYYYGATWNTSRKGLYNWKEEKRGTYEELVKSFFDRERVVKVLTDFILFTRQDDELKKVVLRPHQMRSVGKVLERAADPGRKRGLVWHTQGSGKTYTMITAAKQIIETPRFENPTVIMLVDRNELESQLFGNLASVGFRVEDVEADSKKDLRKMLREDKRGLIVSMIHKFKDMPADVNTRDNIFVLVDEAHRTTGGDLGNYLLGALPNATYIGFTGTPIDMSSHGKGTFITFGADDPPKGYLDKYSIGESIDDGTTVELHYTLAPNELRVDKETLNKEFLGLAESEGVSDIEELNKVLARAVNLRNMMKNPERIGKIAAYVAEHYRAYVEPMGYKAFLVGVDREACALYKDALDRHLPPAYSEVVISPGFNDGPELTKFHLAEEAEKRIRKAFKEPDGMPRILIVTEKLLTGFDAPILYCMYLDKPMRDHVLLQAIARVNRPYEDPGRKKRSGFVLDFVGIFDNLEKALAFDSSDIEGVVQDLEVLRVRFRELMAEGGKGYLSLQTGKERDKAVEAVLEHFMDEEERHGFYEFFKELSNIYEILSPDAFLRPYLDDYDTLTRMYKMVKEAFDPGLAIDREFSRKTAKLVQEHTNSGPIQDTIDIVEINEDAIEKIRGSKASDTEKIFNLIKSIIRVVDEGAEKNPYLISIGEKAETIANQFKQRQETTQKVLEELIRLIEEINAARKEQAEKGLSPEVFTIMWLLKKENVDRPEESANKMREAFESYPYWKTDTEQEREIVKRLYKVLVEAGIMKDRLVGLGKKIMSVLTGRARS